MIAYVAQGLGEVGVLDRQHVGGPARNDVGRLHDDAGQVASAPAHHDREGLCSLIAGTLEVGGDARHGRIRNAADDLIIIGADDSDIIRHAQAGQGAGLHNFLGEIVVAGHESGGPRQGPEPAH
jgi:hypothetical protein